MRKEKAMSEEWCHIRKKNKGLDALVGEYVAIGFSASDGSAFCIGRLRPADDHQTNLTLDKTWRLDDIPKLLTDGKMRRCGFELAGGLFFVTSDVRWWAPLRRLGENSPEDAAGER
jgi:hypothetical protein